MNLVKKLLHITFDSLHYKRTSLLSQTQCNKRMSTIVAVCFCKGPLTFKSSQTEIYISLQVSW